MARFFINLEASIHNYQQQGISKSKTDFKSVEDASEADFFYLNEYRIAGFVDIFSKKVKLLTNVGLTDRFSEEISNLKFLEISMKI
jgi:hypothetical protein